MNTADLIEHVSTQNGVAREHTRKLLDSMLEAIIAAAVRGEEVTLTGFGRFKISELAERQGRNPGTGEPITIAASRKLSFAAAKPVREALNTSKAADTAS